MLFWNVLWSVVLTVIGTLVEVVAPWVSVANASLGAASE
jgi:hypothetical protein